MTIDEARKMPSVRLESASEDKLYTVGKVDHDQLSRCLLPSHTLSYLVIHLLLFLFSVQFFNLFLGHLFHLTYCPAMVDPDAPSRKNPRAAQWLHWIVINVDGD